MPKTIKPVLTPFEQKLDDIIALNDEVNPTPKEYYAFIKRASAVLLEIAKQQFLEEEAII